LGNETCGGFPGSFGYYATDSATLSEWGVDLIKAGGCGFKDIQSCNDGKRFIAYVSSNAGCYVGTFLLRDVYAAIVRLSVCH